MPSVASLLRPSALVLALALNARPAGGINPVHKALRVLTRSVVQQRSWKVGDKVQAFNTEWYNATILEIGHESRDGEFRVHYDQIATSEWLKGTRLRARPDEAAVSRGVAAARATGPRAGQYHVVSFGGNGPPIVMGTLDLLPGGRYRVTLPDGRVRGDGRYTYDAATGTVRWVNGPFTTDGYGGEFSSARDGKSHELRLKSGIVAVNGLPG